MVVISKPVAEALLNLLGQTTPDAFLDAQGEDTPELFPGWDHAEAELVAATGAARR